MTSPTPPGWEDILDPGETILWQGAPDPQVRLTGGLGQSLFGLFFAGFALFWIAAAAFIGNDTGFVGMVFPLFGVPFLLIGLYMVFGRFIWDAYVRRGTFYTLTNKRAYIATATLGQRKLAAHDIAQSPVFEYVQGPPDSVYFTENRQMTKNGSITHKIGFEFIENSREVVDLIRRIRKGEV
ncbi:aspartate carbamoyltransferase catalytic subunit [Oceaniglobus ichthyenteri]|uniref:aspartate carbamoyltransferase catalytic subunit n=1 Tax=Oceaniglobus ichthyenteri TaxID=2136177 RepID=UPI000D3BBB35|nr:aspartate carbamoyltransferase catalytic subunit [Oceaniglobus ichthyenteri]